MNEKIKQLQNQEKQLQFDQFLASDGRIIGNQIIDYIESNQLKHVGVRISINNLIVVQMLMNNKREDSWLARKERTVYLTGHSTLLATLLNEETNQYPQIINNEEYVIGGGGFPIIVNNQVIGAICVSGLDHESDHNLIVEILEAYKQRFNR